MDFENPPTAFYRVIVTEEQLQSLRLPLMYVLLEEDAHRSVHLWSRSNREHEVKVEVDADGIYWFTDGWPGFVEANRISVGVALIFVYQGDSIFEVYVANPD